MEFHECVLVGTFPRNVRGRAMGASLPETAGVRHQGVWAVVSDTMADSMYDFRTVFWRSCRSADGSSAYPKAVDKAVKSSREARKGREVFLTGLT